MPVWHEAASKAFCTGKLVILGVTHEQHADRCRLFAQWHRFDWPILHDPINLIPTTAVPMVIAIDEHGIVRSTRLRPDRLEEDFLNRTYTDDASDSPPRLNERRPLPEFAAAARAENTAAAWRAYGDALVLWGGQESVNDAIGAYVMALEKARQHPDILFRLGVVYRMRHELPTRNSGDFQRAVDYWQQALALSPNQYIWRRRIQQYGPRLDKPYPFYDWVDTAIAEIKARGETPVVLSVPPYGAEIARPSRDFAAAEAPSEPPDPDGRINRDRKKLIEAEVAVVPATRGGKAQYRVHIALTPNRELQAHWNNEAEPLQLWVDIPEGASVSKQLLTAPQPKEAESSETRRLDFEVSVANAGSRELVLNAYALYYVCEGIDGTCLYLRQDIPITIRLRQ